MVVRLDRRRVFFLTGASVGSGPLEDSVVSVAGSTGSTGSAASAFGVTVFLVVLRVVFLAAGDLLAAFLAGALRVVFFLVVTFLVVLESDASVVAS